MRSAHRYLSSCLNRLDYPAAVREHLPIGSGLIMGAHRHVLLKRLKISGAWWKQDNLIEMAHLRVCRAKRKAHLYWAELKRTA